MAYIEFENVDKVYLMGETKMEVFLWVYLEGKKKVIKIRKV